MDNISLIKKSYIDSILLIMDQIADFTSLKNIIKIKLLLEKLYKTKKQKISNFYNFNYFKFNELTKQFEKTDLKTMKFYFIFINLFKKGKILIISKISLLY